MCPHLCPPAQHPPQDFFGLIEEMRVWRVVRTPEEIRQGMVADDGRGAGADFNHPGIDKDHKGEGAGGAGTGLGARGCEAGGAEKGGLVQVNSNSIV